VAAGTIWRRHWRELGRALLAAVMPAACPACGEPSEGLCPACDLGLQRLRRPVCRRCGEPLLTDDQPCRADHRRITGIAMARAPFAFADTGGRLVRRFKLDGDAAAGRYLATAMARAVAGDLGPAFRRGVVVSVPLHRRRRRQRGFDQAAWLATSVARDLGLSPATAVLARNRATLPQGDPRVLSRERNVEGVFELASARPIVGRAVLLVDDVCTSGATARACAAALRSGGATMVALLTACRA
jgi:ComF family protein